MVKYTTEISRAETVAILRKKLSELPPPPISQFKIGDAVLLDIQCVGVVSGFDDEGHVYVLYIDECGDISGPAFGYELTKLPL